MEPLLEHARMLDEALAKVRLDERRLSDRARKHRRRRVGATGCATAWCTDVALAIAALDDFRPELAAQWLAQPDRRGAPLRQGAGAAEALALVEERLLAEDAGALATMATPGSSRLNSHGIRVARAFVAEKRLASWVLQRNRDAGLPVTSAAAADRFTQLLGDDSPVEEPRRAEYGSRRRTGAQHWERHLAERWRGRHPSVKYGSMRSREPLTPQERSEKACRNLRPDFSRFLGPEFLEE